MNKAKSINHSLLLREMAAIGIPLDLSVVDLDVEIEQVGAPSDSHIFDLPDGRCGWISNLLIINHTSSPIPVRDIEPRPFWPNSEFEWLRDPREEGADPFNYHFPGKGAPEFPRGQVINHIPLEHGILKPGCPVRGLLLGIGNPKPETLLLGGPVEVTLAIIGHDHCKYEERITLWVDPVMKRQQNSSRRVSTEGLYASERAQNFGSPNLRTIGQSPGRKSAPAKKFNDRS